MPNATPWGPSGVIPPNAPVQYAADPSSPYGSPIPFDQPAGTPDVSSGYAPAQPSYQQQPVYQPQPAYPAVQPYQPAQPPQAQQGYSPPQIVPYDPQAKSRVAAGLLGIFLGGFGIHRFYLGYTGVGIAMLLLLIPGSFITFGLSGIVVSIWGFVEGIVYLCARQGNYSRDASGRPLRA